MNDSNQPVQNIQNLVQKLETNSCKIGIFYAFE